MTRQTSRSANSEGKESVQTVDYNAVYEERGIPGLLRALQEDHGTEFIDANKAFMATRKPFSDARYEEVAIFFDLELNPDDPFEGWEDLIVPEVLLPSSVLTEICLRALQSNVSPGPPTGFKNEAATAAFLAGPFQTLVCLFGGILRDRPEQHISGTELSSGGRIEGEIFCQEKLLLFVKELKHDVKVKFAKALAQVLCELFAAWHFNRRYNKDVEDILPVRACLCDAVNAYFISYDGNRFTRHVAERPRAGASISDQVLVTLSNANYTFGILLEGYLHAVTMSEKRSVSRGKAGDKRKRGSERKVVVVKPPSMSSLDRESTEGWGEAVEWGGKSLSCFRRAHTVKSDNRAEEGLQLLFKSISAWPTSSKNPRLFPHKLKNLCADVIARHVQTLVADDPEPSWEPQMSEIGLPESEKSEPEILRKDAVIRFFEVLDFPSHSRRLLDTFFSGDTAFDSLVYCASESGKDTVNQIITPLVGPILTHAFTKRLQKCKEEGLFNLP